jgi:hypothetical protein
VARRLEATQLASLQICYFDSIGVPDASEMIRDEAGRRGDEVLACDF